MKPEEFNTVYMRMSNSITDVLLKKKYAMKFYGDDNIYLTPIGEDKIEELFKEWLEKMV